jgi:hypothetical protein
MTGRSRLTEEPHRMNSHKNGADACRRGGRHQPAHRAQVAQALPGGWRAGLARSQLAPDEDAHEPGRALHERIEQLRRSRMPMRRIATIVGRSVSTVSRLLARLGCPA